jgi:hypothetical protein
VIRWGVLGLGRAGRARARAIQACERSTLVVGLRGDLAAVGVPAAASLDDLLGQVDAVAVCSPDDTHPALVRAALEAGCHVACEYPLAPSRVAGEALFALSAAKGRVLHVEHIELLASSQQALRDVLADARVTGGTIFDQGHAGDGPGQSHLARIHRLVDLLGLPVRVTPGVLTFVGATVRLDAANVPDFLTARRGLALQTDRGELSLSRRQLTLDGVPVLFDSAPGLFARDHACAVGRILDSAVPYVSDARVLAVLGVLDRWSGRSAG